MTGTQEYMTFFRGSNQTLKGFFAIVNMDPIEQNRKMALSAIVNLSADAIVAEHMIQSEGKNIVSMLIRDILDPESEFADLSCNIISNLTRYSNEACHIILSSTVGPPVPKQETGTAPLTTEQHEPKEGEETSPAIYKLLDTFALEGYNKKNQKLHWLGAVFANISRLPEGRAIVINKEKFAFQRLLTFLNHTEPVRRGGVVAMIRNVAFDAELHMWLLGDDVNILPALLLPLAGPEEFDEEEMEGMPDDLQYLDDDKTREPDIALRKMLVETLLQLCTTRSGRDTLREKKVYPIIRELHKWEKTDYLEKSIYDLVQILQGDEDDITDNLRNLAIPEDLSENPTYNEDAQAIDAREAEMLKESQFGDSHTVQPF
ncbi:hypothetical protein SARC_01257 [Sphaeroforma arctica JP610]|uniref:Protein HGH1 homolog n=1 Tax=Sphaeroforma arctica JP610 TaxID=667725 RepID=A0A0L0GEG1_9EUKA|nr:hypothetical protein SARC_01257 [Sphaeroforma arctica JP610]KNC86628.1 hypothetical protein SARC_01257 [Sphaeroforma arctica JP610]|eukprot:XP_014160530.1 hypothetical protein SARC_01257 [Sphaeroforma arctica JP610]